MSDGLLEELGELASCGLDEGVATRIRTVAHEAFLRAEPSVPPWAASIAAVWRTRLEPAMVVAGSGVFLGWAVKKTIELLS